MRQRLLAGLAGAALLLACQPAELTDAQRAAIEDDIRQLYADQATILNALDAEAWIAQFQESEEFTFAIQGGLQSYAEFVEQVRTTWPDYTDPEFSWGDLHIEVLTPEIAFVTSTWDWAATDAEGVREPVSGTWTAVLVRHEDAWKIRTAAETLPEAETEG